VKHPEDDNYLCQLLDSSGYLSIWQIEKDKNPWQYDVELMRACPVADIEDYCWSVLANEDEGLNRYVVNRGGYALFSKQFDLRFFHVMLSLYDLLASLHRTRVEVAVRWLEANRLLDPKIEKPPLRPHTAEWFAALEVWDPPKAAMTRKVIELAESVNVCSICGDDPANDYRLEEAYRPASGVDTLRLCDDCLAIRKLNGDPFILFPNVGEKMSMKT